MSDTKLWKHQISLTTLETLAPRFASQLPGFQVQSFLRHGGAGLDDLELKARVQQVAAAARGAWPGPLAQLIAALPLVGARKPALSGFSVWPLLQVIEDFGLPVWQESLAAMHALTGRWSAEFAIRPYLRADPERALAVLQRWAADPDEHVRRLVSEGTRPRLPWGEQLVLFVSEPEHTLPLLELLRADPAEYVRRSVSNHLNDIAKDHPDRVVDVLGRWQREAPGPATTWIVRHASRTLIKQGHPGALALRGFARPAVVVEAFDVGPDPLDFGGRLQLHATLRGAAKESQRWAVDFVMHHVKANGGRTAKVFKWREVTVAPGAVVSLDKAHAIRAISTRRYYPGLHRVELQVNGQVLAGADFTLQMPAGS